MVTLKESTKRARHLMEVLEGKWGKGLSEEPRSVLSQLIFNIIARNFTRQGAQEAFEKKLLEQFVDWNEVRVSSVSEIQSCLEAVGAPNAELKAKNIKKILIDVYNDYNQISLEFLHEMTEQKAKKVLENIRGGTPRVVESVLLFALDHSVVPEYSPLLRVCRRTGIVERDASRERLAHVLMKVIPRKTLDRFCRLVIDHAERLCVQSRPKCKRCPFGKGWCPEPARLAALPKSQRGVTEPDFEKLAGTKKKKRKTAISKPTTAAKSGDAGKTGGTKTSSGNTKAKGAQTKGAAKSKPASGSKKPASKPSQPKMSAKGSHTAGKRTAAGTGAKTKSKAKTASKKTRSKSHKPKPKRSTAKTATRPAAKTGAKPKRGAKSKPAKRSGSGKSGPAKGKSGKAAPRSTTAHPKRNASASSKKKKKTKAKTKTKKKKR